MRYPVRRSLIVLLLLVLPLVSASAQSYDTPEAVVSAGLRFVSAGDYMGYASVHAPEDIEKLMDFMFSLFEYEPDIAEVLAIFFGPEATMDDLRNEDPALVFGTLMENTLGHVPMFIMEPQILGTVYESAEVAHVVVRTTTLIPGVYEESSVEIVSTRRTEDGWRVIMKYDPNQLLSAVWSYIEEESGRPIQP